MEEERNIDVRLVTLKRKNVGLHDMDEAGREISRDKSVFFATDYFDVMSVKTMSAEDDFTRIMGVCPDDPEKDENGEIAVQSFVLYSDSASEEEGDPFTEQKTGPFLSVIQIHITPEILADIQLNSNETFTDIFHEDLRKIVGACTKETVFTYKVYQLLSSGDFAVVVRSRSAETAFEISTAVRKRVAQTASGEKLVLYKTYTLLTIDGCIIEVSEEDPSEEESRTLQAEGQFVIRGVYSNRYWSNRKDGDKTGLTGAEREKIYGLNGRYDFSVRLTAEEFRRLFPRLKRYKFPENTYAEQQRQTEGQDFVSRLWYLMDQGYLSYINERYLLDMVHLKEIKVQEPLLIKIERRENEKFLDELIGEKCRSISDDYQKIRDRIADVKGYRKNMNYYMALLGKLLMLCQTINISSDTRVYAVFLLEQLKVVFSSLNIYLDIYDGNNTGKADDAASAEVLELISDYLRVSVYTLNSYANYIRNNNLQSLQTPNYNIESKVSMEKILIGYSEFLKCFMNLYRSYRKEKGKDEEKQNEYLPIVAPDLQQKEVSVEVMFQEGNGADWNVEKKIRSSAGTGGRKYLLVITTPTLLELNSTRNLSVSLFHEIAHQFRYESREERNRFLTDYVLERVCRNIAQSVWEEINLKTERRVSEKLINHCLYESLLASFKEHLFGSDEDCGQPLNRFSYSLQKKMERFLKEDNVKAQIDKLFKRFLMKINDYVNLEEPLAVAALAKLEEQKKIWINNLEYNLDKTDDAGVRDEIFQTEEIIVNCAFATAYACSDTENKTIIEDLSADCLDDWCAESHAWTHLDEYIPEQDLREAYWTFADWIYTKDDSEVMMIDSSLREQAVKESYKKLCNEWEKYVRNCAETGNTEEIICFAETGRILGVDWDKEKNQRQYAELIQRNMNAIAKAAMEDVDDAIKYYREVTADIFMCKVLDLSAFGYMYLLAENLPNDGDVFGTYEERIAYVTGILSGTGDEIKLEELLGVCGRVIDKICRDVDRMLNGVRMESEKRQDLAGIRKGFLWEYGSVQCLNSLTDLEDYADGILREDELRDDYAEILKRYKTMIQMVRVLYGNGNDYIGQLNAHDSLKQDLLSGKKVIASFRKYMQDNEDVAICKIADYCDALKEMMENPFEGTEENARILFNRTSINFFLSMYYLNKMNCAKRLKGDAHED